MIPFYIAFLFENCLKIVNGVISLECQNFSNLLWSVQYDGEILTVFPHESFVKENMAWRFLPDLFIYPTWTRHITLKLEVHSRAVSAKFAPQ